MICYKCKKIGCNEIGFKNRFFEVKTFCCSCYENTKHKEQYNPGFNQEDFCKNCKKSPPGLPLENHIPEKVEFPVFLKKMFKIYIFIGSYLVVFNLGILIAILILSPYIRIP